MSEAFLHFLWKHQLLGPSPMCTMTHKSLKILHPGVRNRNAGPDFTNARIEINHIHWAGNVELHTRASEWEVHGHHNDPSYNNVILHVVLDDDQDVFTNAGRKLETFTLMADDAFQKPYEVLIQSKHWLACKTQLNRVDPFMIKMWLGRILYERFMAKTSHISVILERNRGDWEESFYQDMARSFGFQVNSEPFERLARSLPLKILFQSKNSLFHIEALVFGQSGLLHLELFGDPYFKHLKKEYNFLQKKYGLRPMEGHNWKFLRMRPRNFPTLRMAQFAALMYQTTHLFSNLMACREIHEVTKILEVEVSSYWQDHYYFNRRSKPEIKKLGIHAKHLLIINTIIPYLFLYGEKKGREDLKNRALAWLETLPPENNAIVRTWHEAGIHAENAFYSQSLIHLKKEYCEKKRCLDCEIGNKIITGRSI